MHCEPNLAFRRAFKLRWQKLAGCSAQVVRCPEGLHGLKIWFLGMHRGRKIYQAEIVSLGSVARLGLQRQRGGTNSNYRDLMRIDTSKSSHTQSYASHLSCCLTSTILRWYIHFDSRPQCSTHPWRICTPGNELSLLCLPSRKNSRQLKSHI